MQTENVPTHGLLTINHAYNEGRITFKEWLELSREWALKMIEQQREGTNCSPPLKLVKPSEPEAAAG